MSKKRNCLGETITLVYVACLICIAITRWSELRDLDLNELGDVLAGAFGPLAFVWLVLGYFQQGEELRQNTEALRLQAAELRASVEQQALLVQANKAALLAAERPILTVSASNTEGLEGATGVSNFKATMQFKLQFSLNNAGRTHAMRVRLIGRIVLAPTDHDLIPEWEKLGRDQAEGFQNFHSPDPRRTSRQAVDESAMVVAPNTTRELRQIIRLVPEETKRAHEYSRSNGGMWPRICVLGFVLYESMMGSKHMTAFGFEVMAPGSPNGRLPFTWPTTTISHVTMRELAWIVGPTT